MNEAVLVLKLQVQLVADFRMNDTVFSEGKWSERTGRLTPGPFAMRT